jgi:hypothetical protein
MTTGVAFGYVIYIMIGFFTGEMFHNTEAFYLFYTRPSPKKIKNQDVQAIEDENLVGIDGMYVRIYVCMCIYVYIYIYMYVYV